jgi:hypothetical protein
MNSRFWRERVKMDNVSFSKKQRKQVKQRLPKTRMRLAEMNVNDFGTRKATEEAAERSKGNQDLHGLIGVGMRLNPFARPCRPHGRGFMRSDDTCYSAACGASWPND